MGHLKLLQDHLTTLDLDFGTFKLYRNLVIGEVHEGVVINADHALELISFSISHYPSMASVVYLSHRRNSYSVDPTMYLETGRAFPALAGYGIIYHNELNRKVALLEQKFLPYPSKLFTSLGEAIEWAGTCVSKTPGIPQP
ncbi:hypothetical protein SAMN04490243_0957 [Robiginitalea myxolifaciens]|uniref:SpoIIAA-like n=1 Tax=Robiginitalea myxolifaciens TaxID=400055 RepID=A0A1I6FZ45_9FLAO|nr:hypothetical protein [Robiginitalea myxolifaciens]SFR35223.1 hypothetical protein SAMN04490243_0957 [Robiginitalea myxolifaciens]